jgi:phosphatidylserine/phosphatidylglycerophosphate/cardiolipin synthase-like enzyme
MSIFCLRHSEKLLQGRDPACHAVSSLETGDEALFVRTYFIRNAVRTIDIQTFIFANDETGRFIAYELLQAAERGVRVRLLLDAWVLLGNPSLLAFLNIAHPNIELRHYNPPAKRLLPATGDLIAAAVTDFSTMNHRMHNKAFIVDNSCAIVGGRNYQNDYYDRSATRNFRDREVLVCGPVVAEMTAAFEVFWSNERAVHGQRLNDFQDHAAVARYRTKESFEFGDRFDELCAAVERPETIRSYFEEKLHTVPALEFITDLPSNVGGEPNDTVVSLIDFFSRTEEYLVLQSPYFVLDPVHLQALKKLRERRPQIPILVSTNSLASTDNAIAYAHSSRERTQYLAELLLEIFEYRPIPADTKDLLGYHRYCLEYLSGREDAAKEPPAAEAADGRFSLCLHAKTFVRDDAAVWIGSCNIDPRSARINSENAVIIHDGRFCREVAAQIRRDIRPENSWTVGFSSEAPTLSTIRELLQSVLPEPETPADGTGAVSARFFRYTENFELKDGGAVVPFFHPDFYKNFAGAGAFPQVNETSLEIQVRLISFLPDVTKMFV